MYVLAGIYFIKPEIFKYIPNDEYFGMDTLIKTMLKEKEPITKYDLMEYWLDIGKLENYEKAQNIYQEHFEGEI